MCVCVCAFIYVYVFRLVKPRKTRRNEIVNSNKSFNAVQIKYTGADNAFAQKNENQ